MEFAHPGVAPSVQPRALIHNAVGIEDSSSQRDSVPKPKVGALFIPTGLRNKAQGWPHGLPWDTVHTKIQPQWGCVPKPKVGAFFIPKGLCIKAQGWPHGLPWDTVHTKKSNPNGVVSPATSYAISPPPNKRIFSEIPMSQLILYPKGIMQQSPGLADRPTPGFHPQYHPNPNGVASPPGFIPRIPPRSPSGNPHQSAPPMPLAHPGNNRVSACNQDLPPMQNHPSPKEQPETDYTAGFPNE